MNEKPTVLITGAGTGIGAATARLFSQQGHDVILTGRRADVLQQVASELTTNSHVIPADLTDEKAIIKLIEESLKRASNLGILVNNAGTFRRAAFVESEDNLWQDMFNIHLMAPVRLSRGLLPHFENRHGGVIVNVASTLGIKPIPGVSAYSTLKAAMISFTKALALEVAPSNVRVNVVCPGIVDTPIHNLEKLDPESAEDLKKQWAGLHPLKKLGRPEDVAWAVYQLTTPPAHWITGAVIPVDGGISLV